MRCAFGEKPGSLFLESADGEIIRMDNMKLESIEIDTMSKDQYPASSINFSNDRNIEVSFELEKPPSPIDIAMLFGMPVIVLPKHLVSEAIGFEQRRKHRKKRINKKWLKRYGFKTVYGPEKSAYIVDNKLFVGPDTYEWIKDEFEVKRGETDA